MNTGIVRKIDDLGRVVIPAEMRHVLGVKEGDQLEITLEGDHVAIRPRSPAWWPSSPSTRRSASPFPMSPWCWSPATT